MNRHRLFLISNMYPSRRMPAFGIFVKKFEDNFLKDGGEITARTVISMQYSSYIMKLLVYVRFYLEVLFKGFFKQGKYDVIYVHYIAHTSIPVFLLSLITRKKLVLNIHGDDILPRSALVSALMFFVSKLLKKANLIVVPSDFFYDELCNRFERSHFEGKIFVSASGGIDRKMFCPQPGSRDRMGIDKNSFVVGYVSRIDEGKGWEVFLDAVKALKEKKGNNIVALMAGRGPQIPDARKYIEEAGLRENVLFFEGVKNEDLNELYSVMDVFIFPTMLKESLGLVGLEAMACGIPVIGSDIGGLKTYISNDYNGFLAEPGNTAEFIRNLEMIKNWDASKRAEIVENCIRTVEAYDADVVSQKLFCKVLSI